MGIGAAGATSIGTAEATESTTAATGLTLSGGDSERFPKYRRSVNGIVNSNPYLIMLVPRDDPCSVATGAFVAWMEIVCGVSGIAK